MNILIDFSTFDWKEKIKTIFAILCNGQIKFNDVSCTKIEKEGRMDYLNLETCKLLEKLGCTSESERGFFRSPIGTWQLVLNSDLVGIKVTVGDNYIPAFTWDDICTKSNAVIVWGNNELKTNTTFHGISESYVIGTSSSYEYHLRNLLNQKLNGGDWESALLQQLKLRK